MGNDRMAEKAIRNELLAARRRTGGLSPREMAKSPVLSDVLGNGDPEVAHVELGHKLLETIETEDDVIAIEAACYSLGYASEADTHLRRLEEFGAKRHLDQRQARRYSDRGIDQLARLISTHWTTQTVPEATLIIVGTGLGQIGFSVQLKCQRHVDMRACQVSTSRADQDDSTTLDVTWKRISAAGALWMEDELEEPKTITFDAETIIRLVWRGEAWPKFTVALTGDIDAGMVTSETLGAACAVTFKPG
jgi:hypothetical protein